ncbi:MAG TPA: hypothetical protein VLJ15_07840 [Gammaproteobacteria bacterium]|nr:hypothetical protein [Gammaproteobacteria bacterium]
MKKQIPFLFLSLIPLVIIILAIWLPYGFTMTGLMEEWGLLGVFTTDGPVFFGHTVGALAQHALRPLMIFSLSLSYALDPNSFFYWHILTILALLTRSLSACYLLWVATNSRFWAILMGILVLIFPADTMQLAFRGLGVSSALSLLLMGSACCVVAYRQNRPAISGILACFASILFLFSIWMYEAACGLILLPFMILFVRQGFFETLQLIKSRFLVTMLWLAPLAIYAVYWVMISPKIQSYQNTLMGGQNPLILFFHSLPKLFSIGMLRSLLGGWFDALRMTLHEYSGTGYVYLFVITGLITGFLLLCIRDQENTGTDSHSKKYWRLGLIGLLSLIAGYAPYLLSPYHLATSQRTLLFATPGAAMVWIAALMLLFHWKKWLTTPLIFFLILIGTGAQLFQFHHYAELSRIQRTLLKNMIENFDGNLNGKTLVIFDKSNRLDHMWMLLTPGLESALTYFYGHPIEHIEVCYLPTGEWRSEWSSPIPFNHLGTCHENKNSWRFQFATPTATPNMPHPKKPPDIIFSKKTLIAITINPDASVTPVASLQKYRNDLREGNSVTAIRYRNILMREPGQFSQSLWTIDPSQYKWQFGDWWGLEQPIQGSGWNDANWAIHYFHHHASALKSDKRSTLLFNLVPAQKPYFLSGKFSIAFTPAIHDTMRIRINGHPLDVKWDSDGKFNAVIPMNTLLSGINTIAFDTEADPVTSGLSGALEWFNISTEKN